MKGSKRLRKKKTIYPNIPAKYILKNGMLTKETLIKIFGVEEESYKERIRREFQDFVVTGKWGIAIFNNNKQMINMNTP